MDGGGVIKKARRQTECRHTVKRKGRERRRNVQREITGRKKKLM